MNNETVMVVYDNTGRVWGIYNNVIEVPESIQGVVTTAPENYKSVYVNPDTKEVIFEIVSDTEEEVANLQETVSEIEK